MGLQINKRERLSIGFAALLILGALAYQFAIEPFLNTADIQRRQLKVKKQALREIRQMGREYDQLLNKNKTLKSIYARRDKGFTLFAFLEKLAVKSKVNTHIDYMKPSSTVDKKAGVTLSVVEMKLKGIKLSQLMSYLYRVETSKNIVFIKRLAISRDGKKQDTISAVLHVETINT